MSEQRRYLSFTVPELVLVSITIIWGGTFLAVQIGVSGGGPLFFVGLRFAAATIALLTVSWRWMRGLTLYEIGAGSLIGLAIMGGYCLQTVGLQWIPSSKSAFITALYVPFVPLLQLLVLRRRPQVMAWVGIVLAFAGLVLLAGPDGSSIEGNLGEILTLIGAVSIAAEIILIGGFAGKVNARRVTVIQLGAASFLSFAMSAVTGEALPQFGLLYVGMAAGLGVASAGIQFAMNWAQRTVPPTRATLIYAGEPVWAGIVGRLAGEHFTPAGLVGAGLIVLGIIVSELKLKKTAPTVMSENRE